MTDQQPEAPAVELARLRSACRLLGKVVVGNRRAMEAARIEDFQNGANAGMQWILNSMPDGWDDPETEWDGTESANAWWDRTDEWYRAAEPDARNAEPSRTESPAPVPAGPAASSTDAAEGPWTESPGVALIAAERSRQVTAKGYTPEHDAEHGGGELAEAAVAYALAANGDGAYREFWPFRGDAFQPGGPVRALTKAGALIAAELDRIIAKGSNHG